MGNKQLIRLSALALLLGISVPTYAHGKNDSRSPAYTAGYNQGYPTGYNDGKVDHTGGLAYDYYQHQVYKRPAEVYNSSIGNESDFKKGFKAGFRHGYHDGYKGKEPQMAVAPITAPQAPPPAEVTPEQPPTELPRAETPQAPAQPATGPTQQQPKAKALPKTASSLPLLGLIGFAGISLSFLLRALRNPTA